VFAPISLFWARAIGLNSVTRAHYSPSFRVAGTGPMLRFGLGLLARTSGWTVLTQADTLIAARRLSPHELGLYAEALLLRTLIASKFVPRLNEVAFPAYSRMQEDRALLSASFLKAVRLIMLATCPLYLGLSVVAPDAVAVLLGDKWRAMAPLMTILAFVMPAQTLHILFTPVLNAIGHVRITARTSLLGALIMPAAFLIGLQWGVKGLAFAWLFAFPLLPLFTWAQARSKLGIETRRLAAAVAPGLLASGAMALAVFALRQNLGGFAPWQRLGIEIGFGGACYAGLLLVFARSTLQELAALVLRRRREADPLAAG
jgi:O-antigen/teichoic acid export membrane protein